MPNEPEPQTAVEALKTYLDQCKADEQDWNEAVAKLLEKWQSS